MQTFKEDITRKEFKELFKICMKNDSHRIGILIYSLYLDPMTDMDDLILNIIIQSIKTSNNSHEMKLFYILNHFDKLSI